MYAREDTVNWLLAKRSNTNILGGPLKQSCVHLASARRSGQAAQVRSSSRYNTIHALLEVTNILFSTCTNIHRTVLMRTSY